MFTAFPLFFGWKKNLFSNYDGFFNSDDDTNNGDGQERVEVAGEIPKEYSWFAILHRLCGADITKWEQVTKLNFIFCLNWLSYEKMKIDAENEEIKKQIAKNKK